MDAAVIARNRFGLGARPGELERDQPPARDWLLRQLQPRLSLTPPSMAALPDSRAAAAKFEDWVQARARERRAGKDSAEADAAEQFRQTFQQDLLAEIGARADQQVRTETPFLERLVLFWSNHFALSADKPQVTGLIGPFEREGIRPRLLGSFADLLIAAEQHPAMLRFLDNANSFGPGSEFVRDPPRRLRRLARNNDQPLKLGLNENLAREILELHTLGVNGGYTQADVVELAKGISGWTVQTRLLRGGDAVGSHGFVWFAEAHEPGARELLGHRYPAGGREQGEAMLRELARHPATARFLATKLARHFVADQPPASLVSRLEQRYLASGGDLSAVYQALIDAPEAWQPEPRKLKRPEEFLVSALRATGLPPPREAKAWAASLSLLGQAPMRPGSPAGWPDEASAWIGPDGLWKRMQVAEQISEKLPARTEPLALARSALGPWLQADTVEAMRGSESTAQAVAILLSSPEFQWR